VQEEPLPWWQVRISATLKPKIFSELLSQSGEIRVLKWPVRLLRLELPQAISRHGESCRPMLFALLVYAVGIDRPLSNSLAALLGHKAAYLGFGILIGGLLRQHHGVAGESGADRLPY
jgi:hypothetical protein